jgi:CubicO group peptidase (beta-lactamase class C family)
MKRHSVIVALSCLLFVPAIASAADGSQSVAVTMRALVDAGRLAGSVTLIAVYGKISNIDCVGHADVAAGRPMRTDTLFWIASMTKPITAASVMILQDEGKLSVDDPVSKYLPEFGSVTVKGGGTPPRPITIKQLLTHTSGVASPAPFPEGANPTLAETVAAIAKEPLLFEPGSQWSYGLGLSVAGRIVEVVSKTPFETFIEERITKPLGMNDTTFYPTAEQRKRIATLYEMDKDTKKLVPAKQSPTFINVDANAPRKAPGPSGGLCSSALDYFHFLQMVLDGGELNGVRILSESAVEQMTSIQTGELQTRPDSGLGWGLGWSVVGRPQGATAKLDPGTFGHGGAFGTQAWVLPERGAVAIMLIGRSDMGSANDIRAIFNDAAVFRLP